MKALPDRIPRRCRILFVGINPGLKSARVGHHYAGNGNRFWRLLYESGLTPRLYHWSEDASLSRLGYGLTNLAARPTRGSGDLLGRDFKMGRKALAAKIARIRPETVAFVGITAWREFADVRGLVRPGVQRARLGRSRVLVLPNPSGRNAHFSRARMIALFRRAGG